MRITLFQVDAFATRVFQGNPAAVCPLDEWLEDELLQKIAEENNLSETAFFVVTEQQISLRWFTPEAEVDLCGHATLAAAHVLYQHLDYAEPEVKFQTRSGELLVAKNETGYVMDFPATVPQLIAPPAALLAGLDGIVPKAVLAAFDYVVVLESEQAVRDLKPKFAEWLTLDLRGVVVTAKGDEADFVSRSFFPKLKVNEDPVTGSAHCELTPYWAKQLNKSALQAKQVSARTGLIGCQQWQDRVRLTGNAVDYLVGEINLDWNDK
ncbi:PhzF family phenazine biosynthesis protein [Paraglaciecola aquimarina]|uniref:PhzF family phenazine biosynthesis protein n=1 Tax=Paraglaciecola aquimarina TaxID=1235557 RepID=A0ABU3STP7_9ALTE|nr:PhzF family phenazine biosynthesis protein [Paraglaciecola aquimarina]MDU0353380.1 PhzF family phenazine biosynthesis protein [Paraglaciecola aquimarina]